MSVYIFFVSFISNIELTKLFRFNVGKDMLSRSLVLPEGRKFQQRRPNLATVLKFLIPHPASKSYSSVLDHNLVRQFCPLRNTTAKIEPPSFSLHGEFFTAPNHLGHSNQHIFCISVFTCGDKIFGDCRLIGF